MRVALGHSPYCNGARAPRGAGGYNRVVEFGESAATSLAAGRPPAAVCVVVELAKGEPVPWFVAPAIVVAAAAAIAGGAALRRRSRAKNEVFIGFDTLFGRANVFTIRQDESTGLHLPGEQAAEAFSWIRVMELDGAYQSATYLDERCYEPVFDYYKLFDRAFDVEARGGRIERVLMLGGGGYAYPKHLISTRRDVRMDVVEIDPTITAIAERYFFLDRLIVEFDVEETGQLVTIHDDARRYLETCEARYDAIMNDLFAGRAAVASLATAEAARLVHERLTPDGVYLANVISPLTGADGAPVLLDSICATLAREFAHVWVVPCKHRPPTEADNHMVIATDGDWRFFGAQPAHPAAGAAVLTDATVEALIPIARVE